MAIIARCKNDYFRKKLNSLLIFFYWYSITICFDSICSTLISVHSNEYHSYLLHSIANPSKWAACPGSKCFVVIGLLGNNISWIHCSLKGIGVMYLGVMSMKSWMFLVATPTVLGFYCSFLLKSICSDSAKKHALYIDFKLIDFWCLVSSPKLIKNKDF